MHRLWVVLTVIYAAVVTVVAVEMISSIQPRVAASNLRYMSDSTLHALEQAGEAREELEIYGVKLQVPPNLKEEEKRKIAEDIYASVLKDAAAERREGIWIAVASWIGPSLLVLALGHSVAWVVRGFRKAEPNQSLQPTAASRRG
jgi:hypothetical protein